MSTIIACHISEQGLLVSYNGLEFNQSTSLVIEFKPDTFYVAYHINQFTATLLKYFNLSDSQLKELNKTGTTFANQVRIRFMPYKFLKLKWIGQSEINFSDMSQYYDAAFLPNESLDSIKNKCKQTWETANTIYHTALKLNLSPQNLTSPINMLHKSLLGKYKSSGYIKNRGLDIPTISDLPNNIVKELSYYAYKCIHGGWTEAFQKGYFKETWDIDLNNAYGFELSKLLDIRYGDWEQNNKYAENAEYGFVLCDVEIHKPFHCILIRGHDSLQYTFVGKTPIYLTKDKIDFILKYKIGTVKIINGYWWFASIHKFPFHSIIWWLWNERQKSNGLSRLFIKRCITGISGLLSQIYNNGQFGDIYNPIYRSIMEDRTQIRLASYIIDNKLENNLLYIATDGLLLNSPPKNLINSNKMGEWKLDKHSSSIVLSSGLIAVQGKEGSGAFSLNYNWLKNSIEQEPLKQNYTLSKYTCLTLGKAIQENRLKDLGNIEQVNRTLDITYEAKRAFSGRPKNGQELLQNKYISTPWDISIIKPITAYL